MNKYVITVEQSVRSEVQGAVKHEGRCPYNHMSSAETHMIVSGNLDGDYG